MKRTYYETPKASRMMRLFWKIAGGDKFLLEKATYSDQLKYTTLGGVVLATGAMAALAGGYAFYTIFCPKNPETGDMIMSPLYVIVSTIFGLIWGLIIFNIDRFIVTSTGKGDGTEKITKDELLGAIPRIIMGIIIAITISKPIEIRMFQTEIQAELYKVKKEKLRNDKKIVEENYKNKLEELDRQTNSLEQKIRDKELVYNQRQDEWDKFTSTHSLSNGAPLHRQDVKTAKDIWDRTEKIYRPQIKNLINEMNNQIIERDKEISQTKDNANSLNGLALRIRLAHKVAGFWISLFITLLFMAIELTPIFFKLMLIKSTYDFMDDNVKELMKAESGILVEYDYYPDKDGVARDLVIHIEKEKQIIEQKELLELQRRLTKYAIEKYEDSMRLKIDENPSKYITSQDNES